jgi:hypothetical protein
MVKTILFTIILALLGLLPVFGTDSADKPGHPSTDAGAPASAAASPMADIHDIRPPMAPGLNPWLSYGLPAALLTGVLAALWLYLRRKGSAAVEKAVHREPPHAVALKSLQDLAQCSDLDGRRFYFRLSIIIRSYMQGRFNIDALEMTIEQLLPVIGALDLDNALQQDLKQCLCDAEPVKFAGRPADTSRMKSDLAFAVEFVTKTTPAEHKAGHN